MLDVAAAIDGEAVPLTHRRRASDSYNADGEGVPGTATNTNISGAFFPMAIERYGEVLKDLPEGVRREGLWMLWTRADVRRDDQIIKDGRTFRVVALWPRPEGGFNRAALGLEA